MQTPHVDPSPRARPPRDADRSPKRPQTVTDPFASRFDAKRYRKIRNFFLKTIIHIAWWDIILNRPGLRHLRRPPLRRWQQLAARYRLLAVEMGGVLIKLGQFLSTRVDILPPEITDELAGLQDAVPPVPIGEITAQIERDFGRPVKELFASFSTEPVGSASLAQVHRARLITGEQVAVKALRPGIMQMVETDLAVVSKFARRLHRYKPIRKYVDLKRLAHEFTMVTSRELDLQAEGAHAERFAADFADDAQTYVPKIHWDYVGVHTLTMEDVSYFKIDDLKAIEAAGIDREAVADKLFDLYMQQVVVKSFVHADPHAGNLFVRPLPHPDEIFDGGARLRAFAPGDPVPYYPDRPFQITFVDFGMAVSIPKRLQDALRNYVIGIGTHDARLIVESYLDAGALLYDADLKQIEEMTEGLLERFSGTFLGQMKGVDLDEYARFYSEYTTLLYNSPFQFQADLLFVMRALGLLSGITSAISPDFNPMDKVTPFAQRLLIQELQPRPENIVKAIPRLLKLPDNLSDVLLSAQRGQLTFKTELTAATKKSIQQLRNSVNWLAYVVVAVGLFLGGVIWHVGLTVVAAVSRSGDARSANVGIWMMALAGVAFLWGMLKRRGQ